MLVTKERELSKIDNRTLIDNVILDQSFKTEKSLEENKQYYNDVSHQSDIIGR